MNLIKEGFSKAPAVIKLNIIITTVLGASRLIYCFIGNGDFFTNLIIAILCLEVVEYQALAVLQDTVIDKMGDALDAKK